MIKKMIFLAITVVLMLVMVACTQYQEPLISNTESFGNEETSDKTVGGEMTYRLTDPGKILEKVSAPGRDF